MNKKIALSILGLILSPLSNGTDYNVLINSDFTHYINAISPVEVPVEPNLNNIALIGTNGLTVSSYTASTTYSGETVSALFDGYTGGNGAQTKINPDANLPVGHSYWVASKYGVANQWISIDFGNTVDVSQLKLMVDPTWIAYEN